MREGGPISYQATPSPSFRGRFVCPQRTRAAASAARFGLCGVRYAVRVLRFAFRGMRFAFSIVFLFLSFSFCALCFSVSGLRFAVCGSGFRVECFGLGCASFDAPEREVRCSHAPLT